MTDDEIISAMASADDPLIRVSAEVHALLKGKSKDYNTDVGRDAYWAFGDESIIQMLWTKVMRMRSLAMLARAGGQPTNEAMEDTARDLISYSLFLIEWKRRTHG